MLTKFLQTKPDVKNLNINYYESYYTVIRYRVENQDVDNQYEKVENDYVTYEDFITPNHYIGIKSRGTMLR